jgi:hypothetical protein
VLPAHISMGMKLAIIERLKEHGDRHHAPDNNFHSLYVKRHQNVRWVAQGHALWTESPGLEAILPSLGQVACLHCWETQSFQEMGSDQKVRRAGVGGDLAPPEVEEFCEERGQGPF